MALAAHSRCYPDASQCAISCCQCISRHRETSLIFASAVAKRLPTVWQAEQKQHAVYLYMATKITKRAVEALTPDHGNSVLWDSDLKGFGVRCRQSGAKFYIVKTRIGGRQRWLTIGRHGSPWTPEAARREALRVLALKATGQDPATLRDRHKGAITVTELGAKFLAEYVSRHCKPRTAAEYHRALKLHIEPALGRLRVAEITRPDIAHLHHKLRQKPYQANRCLAVLSKMMNLAEAWGLRPDGSNPVRHVTKFREKKRERYLTEIELQRLGGVLADAEASEAESPHLVAAIRLLILTGARLSEILTLKWQHVDLANSVLRLPDSKTGAKLIYLNTGAVVLMQGLARIHGNPFVIVGSKPCCGLVNIQKPWRRLRKAANLTDVRIHDLRHSFASVVVSSGMSLAIIGKLLGHEQPATTARYAHLGATPLLEASEAVASKIASLMDARQKTRKIA